MNFTINEPQSEIEKMKDELKNLQKKCEKYRRVLLGQAQHRRKFKNHLTIIAGILALVSGTAITSVIKKYTTNTIVQVVAALTAFLSGFISIILPSYKDDETKKMLNGAHKYLELRDIIKFILYQNYDDKELLNQLNHCSSTYNSLARDFSIYLKRFKYTWYGRKYAIERKDIYGY